MTAAQSDRTTTPTATYRLQFRNGMTFARAAELVPYLRALGISHLYVSPIFAATSGSTHGYDIIDHNRLDPQLGGEAGFEELTAALAREGLGLLLDIVPNHMGAHPENPWWRSVLEWGEASPYGRHFDINWGEKLTIPVLGGPFEASLAAGEIGFGIDRRLGLLGLSCGEALIPLCPSSYGAVLMPLGQGTASQIAGLAAAATPASTGNFCHEIRSILDVEGCEALEAALERLSTDLNLVGEVHGQQAYRLIFWRDAARHLSYRRFFEVTGLAGVRVEDEAMFKDVHRLMLDLVTSGVVDGLRVDHVDGLADPRRYLERLREAVGEGIYLVVEKILGADETLPEDWPVAGTTGYEFIAALAMVLVDEDRAPELDAVYAAAVGTAPDLRAERRRAKLEILCSHLETELAGLVRLTARAAMAEAVTLTEPELCQAIAETIVALPVYRLYGDEDGLPSRDLALLDRVLANVALEGGDVTPGAAAFVVRLLRQEVGPVAADAAREFRRRLQQTSGPVMAKAVEDTLFYRCNRLLALNEVGGDPERRDGSVANFHAAMSARVTAQPEGLLATATHDTKRGEDARARLYAISEAPTVWAEGVVRWRAMQAPFVKALAAGPAPDPETEWLLYQALAGAWPLAFDPDDGEALGQLNRRFAAYLEKAMREAETATSWADVNADYERAVRAYAANLLAPGNFEFRDDFARSLAPFARAGALNSLAQIVLKLAAPGIPDIYQGREGWDWSLVDPDNRREVDFAALTQRLPGLAAAGPEALLADWQDGRIKQFVLQRGLAARSRYHPLFTRGSYQPLPVSGLEYQHVIAFMRSDGPDCAIVLVPRLTLRLLEDGAGIAIAPEKWGDTSVTVPPGIGTRRFRDIFTGALLEPDVTLPVAGLLGRFPVSLLVLDHPKG